MGICYIYTRKLAYAIYSAHRWRIFCFALEYVSAQQVRGEEGKENRHCLKLNCKRRLSTVWLWNHNREMFQVSIGRLYWAVSLNHLSYSNCLFPQHIELWLATIFPMKHGLSSSPYYLLNQQHHRPDAHGQNIV